MKRIGQFFISNWAYLLWFGFYFTIAWLLFGGNLNSLIIVSVLYAVSLSIALSPLGEVLLRFMENCRKVATEKERNYLMPIFEEVYQNAMEENPKLRKDIKLYVMDAMYVMSTEQPSTP